MKNITIAFGNLYRYPNLGDLTLNASYLTIDTETNLTRHSRAIHLSSYANNTALMADINDSSITFKSGSNAVGLNTIAIALEAFNTGQTYGIKLKNTDINVNSIANNNNAFGIATGSYATKESTISLDNTHFNVESLLNAAYGIKISNKENEFATISHIQDINAGSITVKGNTGATGILIDTLLGQITIDNKSNFLVEATANNSNAYAVKTRTDEAYINTHADSIQVKAGNEAYGIHAVTNENQTINNTANVKVESTNQAIGIFAQSKTTAGDININTTGAIQVIGDGNTTGIAADSQRNTNITVASKIDAANATGTGISSITSTGTNNISLQLGANIIGGSSANSAGISMQSTGGHLQLNLAQGSQISSLNDLALSSQSDTGGTTVNNDGKILGYATLTGNEVIFNNQTNGVIDLKNFSSGTKDNITYNIGSANGTFNNAGLIKFSDENFDGTSTHAVFNVATFNHSGVINLTGKNLNGNNDLVGDTFTINGNYVSNGGSIYLNTLLDDASSNGGQGTSDLIVVNGNVQTGNAATKIFITPTASTANLGQLTTGNGIKVVDVQGTSSANAFQLGKPVVAGAYEYTLGQGASDDSWYLSSYAINLNNSTGGMGAGKIQYNPALGTYLANQTAAVQMFQQNLFDRLISSSDGKVNDASKSLFWMRTQMTHGSYDSIHDSLSNRTRSYSLQMGGDLNVWTLDNGGYFHLGLMAGYGDAKNTSKSDLTGTKAEGKVTGYTTGIYGTYFANQDTNLGLYVDLWSQMGWYRNEVTGKAQMGSNKYNSTVWSNAIEVGYGIHLADSGDYQWLATPQLQFTYNHYDADNQRDKNNLYVSNNNASGLDSRLGVRFHARGIKDSLIEPFLEMNWLSTTAKNRLDFNGKTFTDGFAKDRFEAKVGLQGDINKSWSMSAQLGGQWGNNSYNNYQGQLNINYKF